MANPQPDRYTKIANELLEQVPKFKFNGTQLRIILVVWRYTYGFRRKSHEFSLNFLAEATDAGRGQVDRELTALIERNVLKVISGNPGKPRVLQFNKNYEEWDNDRCPLKRGQLIEETGVLENEDAVSSKTRTEVSSKTRTKKRNKETLKKEEIYMSKIQFLDTVFLTQEEYDRLVNDFGKDTVDLFIEKLDEWQTNYPKKTKKDHNKTLRVWIKGDLAKQKQLSSRPSNKQQRNQAEMDILNQFYREGEALEANGDGEVLGRNQNLLP
ncbi:replication protein [Paenibacillus sedimenti]|uniref:Replication protein n=1 Tax=Paenibacillus sedimenti TaxID=2770274 RepID=A0A926QK90_9BACL|nr:replication protein [Paenibacillus sedimenti]MBD0381234.1 replication protein [Paenibacillus sedimenti]